jgi:hypothetical protein
MISKIIRKFSSTCNEKKKLYQFVKECYRNNLKQVEESIYHFIDIDYTTKSLKAARYY